VRKELHLEALGLQCVNVRLYGIRVSIHGGISYLILAVYNLSITFRTPAPQDILIHLKHVGGLRLSAVPL
jgi:hypothetical protein